VAHNAAFVPLWVKIALALFVGLALGIFLLGIAVVVGGAGHGWVTPIWFSIIGAAIYPVVVFRLLGFGDRWFGADVGLILVGAILDLAVYTLTMQEGVRYFHRVGEIAYVWIGLWALWQVALKIKLAIVAFAARGASNS
jgi:hypothetical protein